MRWALRRGERGTPWRAAPRRARSRGLEAARRVQAGPGRPRCKRPRPSRWCERSRPPAACRRARGPPTPAVTPRGRAGHARPPPVAGGGGLLRARPRAGAAGSRRGPRCRRAGRRRAHGLARTCAGRHGAAARGGRRAGRRVASGRPGFPFGADRGRSRAGARRPPRVPPAPLRIRELGGNRGRGGPTRGSSPSAAPASLGQGPAGRPRSRLALEGRLRSLEHSDPGPALLRLGGYLRRRVWRASTWPTGCG